MTAAMHYQYRYLPQPPQPATAPAPPPPPPRSSALDTAEIEVLFQILIEVLMPVFWWNFATHSLSRLQLSAGNLCVRIL